MSVSRIFSRQGWAIAQPKGYRKGVALPSHAAAAPAAVWVARIVMGMFIIGVSYMGFALYWNMKMESSRQLDATYTSRIRAAEASTSDLKGTIQMLGSRNSIDQWAQDNGFVLAGSVAAASLDQPHALVKK